MDATVFGTVGFAALFVVIGLAKLAAWVLDRRQEAAVREIRAQSALAQAIAEVRRGR